MTDTPRRILVQLAHPLLDGGVTVNDLYERYQHNSGWLARHLDGVKRCKSFSQRKFCGYRRLIRERRFERL